MATSERTLSDFLQHSGRFLAELDEGEIVLRRRNGEDLVVMTASQREALRTLSRTFLAVINSEPDVVPRALPWLPLLGPKGQRICLEELRDIAAVALDTGQLRRLTETLDAWEATALATWDQQRSGERAGYDRDAPLPLERPRR